MYSFKNDYSEGAHPKILEALQNSNLKQEEGYGLDSHTKNAINILKSKIGAPECDIHLIAGGTLTNLIAINMFLKPYEACISAHTGHIATHETGAIESTGHKIIAIDSKDGKLSPNLIQPVLEEHYFEHMVKPRLVYISNPTELGTVYTKSELMKLKDYCEQNDLLLYCDGARLGTALCIQDYDVTLNDIYNLTDAFYIGGTKIGALFGEALIIRGSNANKDMRYLIKQNGALLSKGRTLGIQFEELFKDDLYFKLAGHSNKMAHILSTELKNLGCSFLIDSPTNQIFPILENDKIDLLLKDFDFYKWEKVDDSHSAIRLITSWATEEKEIYNFINSYKKILK